MIIKTREHEIKINSDYMLLLMAKIFPKVKPSEILDLADGIYYMPLMFASGVAYISYLSGETSIIGLLTAMISYSMMFIFSYYGVGVNNLYVAAIAFSKYRGILTIGMVLSTFIFKQFGLNYEIEMEYMIGMILLSLIKYPLDFVLFLVHEKEHHKYKERTFIYAYRLMAQNVGEDGNMKVTFGDSKNNVVSACYQSLQNSNDIFIIENE